MEKIYRILGKYGRTTIPFALRVQLGFKRNDLVSFEATDKDTIIIRREKVCDHCNPASVKRIEAVKPVGEESLLKFVDDLSKQEQAAVLQHLCSKWLNGGKTNA